ncbi:MAG TPA: DUF4292 domain-containing protein [Saprospiraceae bacterium]|nr:DUF4292 domain-containing protein [Saprospiraceae bacterium]
MNRILTILLISTALASCGKKTIPMSADCHELSQEEALRKIESLNKPFTWFVSKADLKYNSPIENFNGVLYFRMKSDSLIWMVIKKHQVEAVRLQIFADSIHILDRINNTYHTEPYDKIHQYSGLDLAYHDFQNLLFGNIEFTNQSIDSFIFSNCSYHINSHQNHIRRKLEIDANNFTLKNQSLSNDYGDNINIEYQEYKMTNDRPMAHLVKILAIESNGNETEMLLKFDELEINKEKLTKFTIPEHYDRI